MLLILPRYGPGVLNDADPADDPRLGQGGAQAMFEAALVAESRSGSSPDHSRAGILGLRLLAIPDIGIFARETNYAALTNRRQGGGAENDYSFSFVASS